MIWAICLIARKVRELIKQKHFLEIDLIDWDEELTVTQSTAVSALKSLWELGRPASDAVVVQPLIAGLQRFVSTGSIQNASHAVTEYSDNVAMRMEAELSMVRYIIWAIPSVGFIGTVRGIGDALSQAHVALEGNIAGMTASLGVAFNSTLIALLISIILMFFLASAAIAVNGGVKSGQGAAQKSTTLELFSMGAEGSGGQSAALLI